MFALPVWRLGSLYDVCGSHSSRVLSFLVPDNLPIPRTDDDDDDRQDEKLAPGLGPFSLIYVLYKMVPPPR